MTLSLVTKVVVGAVLLVGASLGGVLTVDVDDDGVPSHEEVGETDPFDDDTDGDGLDDDREREFGSDPRSEDTDGDGIADGTEVEAHLDPTAADSDGDGLSDPRERAGPTDPLLADTDGDNLLDGWEVRGETRTGASIPEADPLHKDSFVHVLYLDGADDELPAPVYDQVRDWFAGMPVQNPDGETGITVHVTAETHTDRSIDEWVHDDGTTTHGVSGVMVMREFYNRETIGEKTGSHFLVVIPGPDVPVRGGGNAGGTKTSIIRQWRGGDATTRQRYARTIVHELLHNLVRKVGGPDCNGQMHTCEGFLSYTEDTYLSDRAAETLNENGFADPVFPDQMNATTCEETMHHDDQCGVEPAT